MEHLFITGKTPLLSLAEICSLLSQDSITNYENHCILSKVDISKFDVSKLQNCLGGTIKIAELKAKFALRPNPNLINLLEENLTPLLEERLKEQIGKRRFGLSIYPLSSQNKKILKKLLILLKKKVRTGGNVRFVNKFFENISSLQINHENLLEATNGVELIAVITKTEVWIGQTIATQNIQAYAKRDYKKPQRDAQSGMLPPKLAQIMLNLAKPYIKNPNDAIYDPFCGTGTILGEGLLQGYNIIGSDKDQKAIWQTQKNLDWLKKEFEINTQTETKLFAHAVEKPFPSDLKKTIAAVVTESYLGPPLKKAPNLKEISMISEDLNRIYQAFFQNIYHILTPNTPTVITFPVFGQYRYSEISQIQKTITKIGYTKIDPISDIIPAQTLIYQRPDQLVGREIQVWIKKSTAY